MITEIEKKIVENINYTNKYLQICSKYIDDGLDTPILKKPSVVQALNELGLNFKSKGNRYWVSRKYKKYTFEFHLVIRRNLIDIYNYIYINDEILKSRISNMGSVLRFLPFDESLAKKINEQGFDINSENDLKNYISDMYLLYNEFVEEYIKEIESGNIIEAN